MKNKLINFIKTLAQKVEPSHPVLLPLMLFVIGLIALNGHKTYQFFKKDPGFCELCHESKEVKTEWLQSVHRDSVCQDCHTINLLSGNKLLLSYIISNDRSNIQQKHGRQKPWESCNTCHLETARQGGVTLRKSYGHARHVFMEKIECQKCHTGDKHNFSPDEKNCLTCHEEKGVHGMGMQSFACLSCHIYGEVTAMPNRQKCLACHQDVPTKGSMSSLTCQSCHKPHGKTQPTEKECTICHANQEDIGRHDTHIAISCLTCHKAHTWKVGKKYAETLCAKCHEYKNPDSFIF